ncbi:hypothetical protein CRENBAI_000102 [Crenichthys baileyi]|uniref:Uncharacterized protein n=1 Tax=Crenichthys baileyi TaxID=28760 RepID=A0AAV9ST92_9TELE
MMENSLFSDLLSPTYSTYLHVLTNDFTWPFNYSIECVDSPGTDVAHPTEHRMVDDVYNNRLVQDLQHLAAHTEFSQKLFALPILVQSMLLLQSSLVFWCIVK